MRRGSMKRVLITGASRGIGAAIAQKFPQEGWEILTPTRAEMDLRVPASITAYFETIKHLEIHSLINNAGINVNNPIEKIRENDLRAVMETNVTAPAILCKLITPLMQKQGYGRIVNISSIWGVISKEGRAAYSMSKNALNGLTNALAVELGASGILVNSVCPGFTKTELTDRTVPKDEQQRLSAEIPLRRFAEPSEIAEIVYFLGSDKNTYITGQKIVIDGGFTVK